MADPYRLERFVVAQDRDGTFETAAKELRAGHKQTHWMWFVFPQMLGLGTADRSKYFGIRSREEASAYLAHDLLGPRLRRCAQLVIRSGAVTVERLMGDDAMKLKSSMTLFAAVAEDDGDFIAVLRRYYHGARDPKTLRLLKAAETALASDDDPVVGVRSRGDRRRLWPGRGVRRR